MIKAELLHISHEGSCTAVGFFPQPQRLALRAPVGGRRIVGAKRDSGPPIARNSAGKAFGYGGVAPRERPVPSLIGLSAADARDAAAWAGARVDTSAPIGARGVVAQSPRTAARWGASSRIVVR